MSLYIDATEPFHIIRFENQSRNAFGMAEAKILQKILKDKPKGILFYSSMPLVFCSGGNLKDYAKQGRLQALRTNHFIRKTLNELAKAKFPTIAIVAGDCIGGGLELLSAFDYVVATPSSLFAFWQRKISLSFGWGGGARLLQRMTKQSLKNHSLDTKIFSAYRAKEIGIVDQIHPSHIILDEAHQWLQKQIDLPQASFSFLKNFDPKAETTAFEKIWGNPKHLEILKTFKGR